MPAIQEVKDIRTQALAVLKSLYALTYNVNERKAVLGAMQTATRLPHLGNYGADTLEMVIQDRADVLSFMNAIVDKEDLQVIQEIEEYAYSVFTKSADDRIDSLALQIKSILDTHAEYQIFKTLIGYRGYLEAGISQDQHLIMTL